MISKNFFYPVLSLLTILLMGCEVNAPINVNAKVDVPTQNTQVSGLSCAISIPANTTVSSGQSVPLTLQVTGGQTPYTYSGVVGTFLTSVTFNKTYTNTGTSSTVVTESLQIKDNVGATASCSLQITVNPPSTPSDLACTLNADVSNPKMNDLVTFSLSATGGTAPYSFSDFTFGNSATSVTSLFYTSPTAASAAARYTAAGLSTASVVLNDSTGAKVTCSKVITVTAGPSISVTATPSTTVAVGSTITLTPTALNFSSNPSITFSALTSGISMTTSGSNVLVTTTDGAPHTVTVNVVATNGAQSATTSIQLNFTSTTTLACTVTTTYNPSYPGEYFLVRANVTSQNTVGTVRLTHIQTSWNASISQSYFNDNLSSYVAIYNSGTFPLLLTVTDDAGHTATCSTSQVVY